MWRCVGGGQDIVERFHLLMALAFVVAEEMAAAGRWSPDGALLHSCAYFFGFEIFIGVPPEPPPPPSPRPFPAGRASGRVPAKR